MGSNVAAMQTRPVAPGGLGLVEDFLRTRDRFADRPDLDEWLASRHLPPLAARDDLAAALRLREALRELAAENNGFPPAPDALAHVNAELDRAAVRPVLTAAGGLEWRTAGGGALAVLLAAVVAAFADGTWSRFKACAADDCRYAFYDHTRNRSARWCDVAGGGDNARMRAYRRRRPRH